MITFIDSDTIFRKIGSQKISYNIMREDLLNLTKDGSDNRSLEFCMEVLSTLQKDEDPFGSSESTKINEIESKNDKNNACNSNATKNSSDGCLLKCLIDEHNIINSDGKYYCIAINRHLMPNDLIHKPIGCKYR